MRSYLIAIMSSFTLCCSAQNKINAYQYWFDGQYSTAVSQGITPVQTFTLAAQIPTSSLLNGLHILNIKFKDDSARYSSVISGFFYKTGPLAGPAAITSCQYWFDNNFSNAITQSASGTAAFTFANDISTLNLLDGLHVLHVRFKDNANLWSETISQFFYKAALPGSPATVTALQYWFDRDFAGATQQSITPGAVYNLSASLPAAAFLEGMHILNIRFLDSENKWSGAYSQFFYKPGASSGNNITKFQYWFDQNYAGAVQQTITPSATYNLSTLINSAGMLPGLHALSIRFLDAKNKWSSTTTQFFYKETPNGITENKIAAYRYWFDERDSILNLVDIAPFMNPFILDQAIAADGIDSGQHVIHFQFRDAKGRWSMVTSDTANVIAKATYTFNGNGNWSNAANWVNKIKPPNFISGTYKIFIDPAPGGQCILDNPQFITSGAIITVRAGKKLVIPGYLDINQ